MSTIPLPELDVRAPQQQNPLEEYGRMMQIKSLMQNQTLQQQEIQQRQIQIQQSQALMQSAKGVDWTKDDAFENFINSAQASGKVNPQTLSQMSLQRAQYKEQLAKTDTATLAAEKERMNQLQGHIDAIKGISDPQKRAAVAQLQGSQILSAGLVKDPQMGQVVQAMASGQHVPSDEQLEMYENGLQDHTTQIDLALKGQQTATSAAEQGKAEQEKLKTQAEMQWYAQHGGAPGVPAEQQQQADWLRKNPGKGPSDFAIAMKKIVPAYNFQLQNAGVAGQGGQPSAIAQGIANGSMKWTDVVSARTPMAVKSQLLAEVKQINPNFNSGDFQVEQRVKEAFTSGSQGQQLTAIATAREHMGTFKQMADALGNGNFLLANQLGQAFGTQFGGDKATNFQIARAAFAGEVGKAFAGASVAEGDRRELLDKINAASSPAQLKGYADTADKLLAGKQTALRQSYQSGINAQPNFGGNNPPTGSHPLDKFWKQ